MAVAWLIGGLVICALPQFESQLHHMLAVILAMTLGFASHCFLVCFQKIMVYLLPGAMMRLNGDVAHEVQCLAHYKFATTPAALVVRNLQS